MIDQFVEWICHKTQEYHVLKFYGPCCYLTEVDMWHIRRFVVDIYDCIALIKLLILTRVKLDFFLAYEQTGGRAGGIALFSNTCQAWKDFKNAGFHFLFRLPAREGSTKLWEHGLRGMRERYAESHSRAERVRAMFGGKVCGWGRSKCLSFLWRRFNVGRRFHHNAANVCARTTYVGFLARVQ